MSSPALSLSPTVCGRWPVKGWSWSLCGCRINNDLDTKHEHTSHLQSLSNTNMNLSASSLALLTISCLQASLATPESVQFEVDFYRAMYRDQHQSQGEARNKSPSWTDMFITSDIWQQYWLPDKVGFKLFWLPRPPVSFSSNLFHDGRWSPINYNQ